MTRVIGTVSITNGVTLALHSLTVHSGPFKRSIFGIDNPGMLSVVAKGTYHFEDADDQPFETTFYGTTKLSPGPILFAMGGMEQQVDAPERFGTRFGREWVRRFYLDPRTDPEVETVE